MLAIAPILKGFAIVTGQVGIVYRSFNGGMCAWVVTQAHLWSENEKFSP
jgi:hypothetical protein